MAFIPFSIGERKCLGYMFAKAIIPRLITRMNYLFDFELTDAEYKDNEDKFPIASVAMNHLPPINMKITLRESVKEIEKDLA